MIDICKTDNETTNGLIQCMCSDCCISILSLCQFLCVCSLSILAVILIRQTYKNKEQVDFVHKRNQLFVIESRSNNMTNGLFIL